jgi:Domain of unknown function (DUF305)
MEQRVAAPEVRRAMCSKPRVPLTEGHRMLKLRTAAAGLCVLVLLASNDPASAANADSQFIAELGSAMNKMMIAMDIRPSGDVDSDFVASMVPHHEGAIEMAQSELRYGKNEQLRRIAQEIIITQQEEIAAMHLAVNQPLQAPK